MLFRMFRHKGTILGLWLVLNVTTIVVLAGPGDCVQFKFPADALGKVDWPSPVKVIRQGAPVYPGADTVSAAALLHLNFNDSFRVLEAASSRVLLGHLATLAQIGWVERADLLCAIAALKGESGAEQRFILGPKYVPHRSSEPARFVNAYPAPDLQGETDHIRQLPGVEGYFVVDVNEQHQSYLLSETYRLDDMTPLVGWVSQDDGVLWTTLSGIRPSEELVFSDGHPWAKLERSVCAYATPEDAVAATMSGCLPIPGGIAWYRSAWRLPVLDTLRVQGKKVYHVLVPWNTARTGIPDTSSELSLNTSATSLLEAYFLDSAEIVEDIWLKSVDLDNWLSFLRELPTENFRAQQGEELRDTFVLGLIDALEQVLRTPLKENIDTPLSAYLSQYGFLVRPDSPLLWHSIRELLDPALTPDCEIAQLALWLAQRKDLLDIVYHGAQRPIYTEDASFGECTVMPLIRGAIQAVPLGAEPELRYNHAFQKANVYWAPKQFLP